MAAVRTPALGTLAALSLLAISCGTANIRAGAPYRKNRAYLYGRFTYSGLSQTFPP